MRFKLFLEQQLTEALTVSQFRELMNDIDYKTLYPTFFNGEGKRNDRKYYPLELKKTDINDKLINKTRDAVTSYLYANKIKGRSYILFDYMQGLAIEKKDKTTKSITDKSGETKEVEDKPTIIKIGKLLDASSDPNAKKIKQLYDQDPIRSGVKIKNDAFNIVFSRHPYDIGGMSTDRGWTSCMNLYSGSNKRFVKKDVENGTIIAYLIKKDDTNIKHPLARVLIKPHIKSNGKDVLLVVDTIYGLDVPEFAEEVTNIINNEVNSKLRDGIYNISHELYNDSKSGTAVKIGDKIIDGILSNDQINELDLDIVTSKEFFELIADTEEYDELFTGSWHDVPDSLKHNEYFAKHWRNMHKVEMVSDTPNWDDLPDDFKDENQVANDWLDVYEDEYFKDLAWNQIPNQLLALEEDRVIKKWGEFNIGYELNWDEFISNLKKSIPDTLYVDRNTNYKYNPKYVEKTLIESWLEYEGSDGNRLEHNLNLERDEIPDEIFNVISRQYIKHNYNDITDFNKDQFKDKRYSDRILDILATTKGKEGFLKLFPKWDDMPENFRNEVAFNYWKDKINSFEQLDALKVDDGSKSELLHVLINKDEKLKEKILNRSLEEMKKSPQYIRTVISSDEFVVDFFSRQPWDDTRLFRFKYNSYPEEVKKFKELWLKRHPEANNKLPED